MRQAVSLVFRVLALAVVLFVGLSMAAVLSGVAESASKVSGGRSPAPSDDGVRALLLSCLAIAGVFAWMAMRSRLVGWRLIGALFLAYFGLGTFLPQIESVVFLSRHLPPGFLPRLFVMGALSGVVFAPAAAWLFRPRGERQLSAHAPFRVASLGWQTIALLAVAYVAAYFLAGYFIAFRNPELVAYYDDMDPGSFIGQLGKVWATLPWLFPFQAFRGVLFVVCVVPFILAFEGGRLELALLIGCAYSVWALVLLSPNAYMPESVRMSHLLETASSNFLFGCLVGALLSRPVARRSPGGV